MNGMLNIYMITNVNKVQNIMKKIINNDSEVPPPEKIGYDNCSFQYVMLIILTPVTFYLLLDTFGILI